MDGFVLVVGAVLLTTTAKKFVDFLKMVTNSDWNGVITQLVAWAGAVGAVFLVAASQFAGTVAVTNSGVSLDTMDSVTKVLVGLGLASTASTVFDHQNAIDNTASAVTPSLLPGIDNPVVAEHPDV